MNYNEFETRLKDLNLSKKDFAKLVNMQYESVINWKRNNIPHWVKSFLCYYEKAQVLDIIISNIETIKNKELQKCEN